MADKSNEYGYVGDVFDQTVVDNSGVFETNDVVDLINSTEWAKPDLIVEYVVVAGGGGTNGSSGSQGGSGAGAGGFRNSYASENTGGGLTTETPLTLSGLTDYTVTIGGGGSGGYDAGATSGSNTTFHTITSTGGGNGAGRSQGQSAGGSGGGAFWNGQTPAAGTPGQGFAGGTIDVPGNSSTGGGGGGGAAEAGNTDGTRQGGDGVQTAITGTPTFYAGGGAGGAGGASSPNNTNVVGGDGGGGYGGRYGVASDAASGSANTGGGGGGGGSSNGNPGGNGGSGVVILRYPAEWSAITTGLTTAGEQTVGTNEKYIVITGGIAGTIRWT